MLKSHTFAPWVAAGLLMGMCLCPAAFASYAVPAANMGTGVVQAVDYASNTFTVNGHIYKVSPKATYAGETVTNIGGLQTGMKIRFIANGPIANPASQITDVVVLPPSSQ